MKKMPRRARAAIAVLGKTASVLFLSAVCLILALEFVSLIGGKYFEKSPGMIVHDFIFYPLTIGVATVNLRKYSKVCLILEGAMILMVLLATGAFAAAFMEFGVDALGQIFSEYTAYVYDTKYLVLGAREMAVPLTLCVVFYALRVFLGEEHANG